MNDTTIEQPQEIPVKQQVFNCVPPKELSRNKWGLREDIDYKFLDSGEVDYRAMVPVKFLYVNPQNKEKIEKKYGKKIEELDIVKDKIQDSDLVINLPGIRYISAVRGFTDVSYEPIVANENYASTVCRILWGADYQSFNKSVSFQDTGSASLNTTKGIFQNYLIEIATNRAFCRAVRGFLRISIVSKDELVAEGTLNQEESNNNNHNPDQNNIISPVEILRKLMSEDKIDFEKIKSQMLKKHKDSPEEVAKITEYKSIDDLPKNTIFDIIGRIKQRREKNSGTYNPVPE